MDTEKAILEKQTKIGALVCAIKSQGKVTKYLLQKRLKQPYFGFLGFVSGKIKWSKRVEEAARRS